MHDFDLHDFNLHDCSVFGCSVCIVQKKVLDCNFQERGDYVSYVFYKAARYMTAVCMTALCGCSGCIVQGRM